MISKEQLGRWLMVDFLDHAIISGDANRKPVLCRVVGQLVEVNKTKLVLAHWVVFDDDKHTREKNREEVVIVKKCIKKMGTYFHAALVRR